MPCATQCLAHFNACSSNASRQNLAEIQSDNVVDDDDDDNVNDEKHDTNQRQATTLTLLHHRPTQFRFNSLSGPLKEAHQTVEIVRHMPTKMLEHGPERFTAL